MIQFPLHFPVSAESTSGIATPWKTSAGQHSVGVSIPPEFSGPGGAFSPEDLYAMALANCFVATFKVIAEKSKLAFSTISLQGSLTVDRDEAGKPWMAAIHLKVSLSGPSDSEKALKLLQKTSESCMILNSTRTQKTFDFSIASSV